MKSGEVRISASVAEGLLQICSSPKEIKEIAGSYQRFRRVIWDSAHILKPLPSTLNPERVKCNPVKSSSLSQVMLLNQSGMMWDTIKPCMMKSNKSMIDLILVYSCSDTIINIIMAYSN